MTIKYYLVGGACRDLILGVESHDYDFVVVGTNAEDFNSYSLVGKDFPVYLEPTHNWEVALARVERKVGNGYSGFDIDCNNITLEEDLSRRDLTINSIAIEVDWEATVLKGVPVTKGTWIDPFKGIQDIEDTVLRHTSAAFSEDPTRCLRVARFLSRFGLEWRISKELLKLMDDIYYSGSLNFLTPERVWLETQKALTERIPSLYFSTLYRYRLFEEIDALYGVPQKKLHHPEVEDFIERLS
jgi:tRNA nucleotidyltransferase (CCA-adding enzyme)